jgi:Ni/Fe-hydrogenase subunit HybB-like protein
MTTVLIAFACFLVGFVAGGLIVRWAIHNWH